MSDRLDQYDDLIRQKAEQHGLPFAAVKAFCLVESSMNPWEYKPEKQYRWFWGEPQTDKERWGQQISWGLMQVMGAVAREHGFRGLFTELCAPEIGLEYGCKHLKKYAEKYGNWPDAIAAYNAGSPRKNGDVYVNQSYVDKVLRAWNQYDPMVPTKETES